MAFQSQFQTSGKQVQQPAVPGTKPGALTSPQPTNTTRSGRMVTRGNMLKKYPYFYSVICLSGLNLPNV